MQPSTTAQGRNPGLTVLPEAGREEQLIRWGLSGSAHWPELDEPSATEYDADFLGADGWDDPVEAARELEEYGFILDGGWSPVDTSRGSDGAIPGARDAGMTAHRGVLQAGEYVDTEALQPLVEAELGFTYEQIRSVYRQGPLTVNQRELRGHIDARLLALSRAGGNMAMLGAALGFPVKADGHCRVMENALSRANSARVAA